MKILLQFSSFKIHFMKIILSSIIFLKISENLLQIQDFVTEN